MRADHLALLRAVFKLLREQSTLARTALQIARPEVERVAKVVERTAAGNSARRGKGRKATAVRRIIAEYVEKGIDPTKRIPRIAKAAECSETYVREIIFGSS